MVRVIPGTARAPKKNLCVTKAVFSVTIHVSCEIKPQVPLRSRIPPQGQRQKPGGKWEEKRKIILKIFLD